MPAPKKFRPIQDKLEKLEPLATKLETSPKLDSEAPTAPVPSPKKNPLDRIPKDRLNYGKLALPDLEKFKAQSLDKHGESLRYRSAYMANLIAEDISALFRKRGKKDVNQLKGLVWSFGVLADKALGGTSTEAVTVRIPAKLLENVKAAIAIQIDKRQAKLDAVPPALDSVSSGTVVESTACEVPVAAPVAPEPPST
jgi:hypothetical protein